MDEDINLKVRQLTQVTADDLVANGLILAAFSVVVAFLLWVFYL